MLRRDLNALGRFVVPAVLLIGLFLLVSTRRYHGALTPQARVYVLCGFAFLFAGAVAAAFSAHSALARPHWWIVRLGGAAAVVAAVAVFVTAAASPVPPVALVLLAGALAVSCWWPPPRSDR